MRSIKFSNLWMFPFRMLLPLCKQLSYSLGFMPTTRSVYVLYVGIRVHFLSLLLCISFSPVLLGLADCTRFLCHANKSKYGCRSLQASGWDGEAKVWKDTSGNSRHSVTLGAEWWQDENSAVYGDHEYRTLGSRPPASLPSGSYSDYMALPAGWRVALNDDVTRVVVGRCPWGSRILAFSGGAASTAGCQSCNQNGPNTAEQRGSAYRCNRYYNNCNVLVFRSRAYINARQCTINASELSGHGARAPINSISSLRNRVFNHS